MRRRADFPLTGDSAGWRRKSVGARARWPSRDLVALSDSAGLLSKLVAFVRHADAQWEAALDSVAKAEPAPGIAKCVSKPSPSRRWQC